MVREVDGCVGCGLLPCHHCTEIEYICDLCEAETDTLYRDLNGMQVCEECLLAQCTLSDKELQEDL